MGDSGGGITISGTTVGTDLTGSSYDGHGPPRVGFIIGMCIWDLTATGGLVMVLSWLFKSIFEKDDFFRSSGEIKFLSFFTLLWIGISSIPGIILVASSDHPAGLIMGYVNLGCSAIPVLGFLLLVVAKSVRLRVEARKQAREQARRQAARYPPASDPPASVPNVAADGHV